MIPPAKKAPPFMKGKTANDPQQKAREAGTEAAKRRLAAMQSSKKPEGK